MLFCCVYKETLSFISLSIKKITPLCLWLRSHVLCVIKIFFMNFKVTILLINEWYNVYVFNIGLEWHSIVFWVCLHPIYKFQHDIFWLHQTVRQVYQTYCCSSVNTISHRKNGLKISVRLEGNWNTLLFWTYFTITCITLWIVLKSLLHLKLYVLTACLTQLWIWSCVNANCTNLMYTISSNIILHIDSFTQTKEFIKFDHRCLKQIQWDVLLFWYVSCTKACILHVIKTLVYELEEKVQD